MDHSSCHYAPQNNGTFFWDYKSYIGGKESRRDIISKPLGRISFLEICDSVARGMQERKAAFDYVLGALVHDHLLVVRTF